MLKFRLMLVCLAVVIFTSVLLAPLLAQEEIVLTLAVQEWMESQFPNSVFDTFRQQHPGVKVVLVPNSQDTFYPPAAFGIEEHLTGATNYANRADVLMVNTFNMSLAATRAGLFLDLAPLVATDTSLNTDDFYPAAWESYQWERGIWAIPANISLIMTMYDANAFDQAGLPYPTAGWTISDYANAARTLAQQDANGNVVLPGLLSFNRNYLLRALYGQPLFEDTGTTLEPRFNTPEMAALMAEWSALEAEGVAGFPQGNYNSNDVALAIDQTYYLDNPAQEGKNWQAAPLPGGTAGMYVDAFAVSAGTAHPELAYALAKHLSENAQVTVNLFGDTPARRSMVGVQPDENRSFRRERSPEVRELIDQMMAGALSNRQMLYTDFVGIAIDQVRQGDTPLEAALQQAEENAVNAMQTASDRRGTAVLSVPTPIPTPIIGAGDVALTFRLSLNISPVPNRDEWEQFISDFIATDPQVRHIDLRAGFSSDPDEEIDCFYQSFSVMNADSLADPPVLSIDPFLDADPNFNRGDMVNGVLERLQIDNRTWGLPLVIEPGVMWYEPAAFEQAGVPLPGATWAVNEFIDALRMLRPTADDPIPFRSESGSSTYLFMLLAAYGAVPYDHRTNPPTLNLADPAVIEAVQQVLDLAREGYISYSPLSNFGGGSGGSDVPIFSDSLGAISWRMRNRGMGETIHQLVTYPTGTTYTPMSLNIGAGYIDRDTLNPEACYRFLSAIGQRPSLLMGMPARRSQLTDPAIMAQGEDVVALYQAIDAQLARPDALIFDPYMSVNYRGGWIEQMWIMQAFDRYVLEDADLAAEMQQAAEYMETFRTCIEPIPNFDILAGEAENRSRLRAMAQCAITIDPSMSAHLSYIME